MEGHEIPLVDCFLFLRWRCLLITALPREGSHRPPSATVQRRPGSSVGQGRARVCPGGLGMLRGNHRTFVLFAFQVNINEFNSCDLLPLSPSNTHSSPKSVQGVHNNVSSELSVPLCSQVPGVTFCRVQVITYSE